MKKLFSAFFLSLISYLPTANAGTIGFEDSKIGTLSGSSHGLTWGGDLNSWFIDDNSVAKFDGQAAHSGAMFAWSQGLNPALTISGANFNVQSLWMRAVQDAIPVTFIGYKNGVQAFSSSLDANAVYGLVQLNYTDIDFLKIETGGQNILFDDLVIDATSVPEPGSATLLMLGLLAIGLAHRRQGDN